MRCSVLSINRLYSIIKICVRGTTVPAHEFAARQPIKEPELRE